MDTSQQHEEDMEGLPPLPEGWIMAGGVPLNLALHRKIHEDLRAGTSYVPASLESIKARLQGLRDGSLKSKSTPEERAFIKAWVRRNEDRRKAQLASQASDDVTGV